MKYLDRFFIKKYSDTLSAEELEKFNVVRERRLNVQTEFEKRYSEFKQNIDSNLPIDKTFFQWCKDNKDYLSLNENAKKINNAIFDGKLFDNSGDTDKILEAIDKDIYIIGQFKSIMYLHYLSFIILAIITYYIYKYNISQVWSFISLIPLSMVCFFIKYCSKEPINYYLDSLTDISNIDNNNKIEDGTQKDIMSDHVFFHNSDKYVIE